MFYSLARATYDPYRTPKTTGSFQPLEQEDAVQEAVTACWSVSEQFDPKRGEAYPFYRTTIANCYAKLYEKAHRQVRNPKAKTLHVDEILDSEQDPERCLRLSYLKQQSEKEDEPRLPPGSRLSHEQVATIRERLVAGETGADLAREYGVNRSTINKIKKGHSW